MCLRLEGGWTLCTNQYPERIRLGFMTFLWNHSLRGKENVEQEMTSGRYSFPKGGICSTTANCLQEQPGGKHYSRTTVIISYCAWRGWLLHVCRRALCSAGPLNTKVCDCSLRRSLLFFFAEHTVHFWCLVFFFFLLHQKHCSLQRQETCEPDGSRPAES